MSRGGRGGARGGMLKGATWEHDADIKLESKPSDLFPLHPNLKKPRSLTPKERSQVRKFRALRDKIHEGPLYTQSGKIDPAKPVKTFDDNHLNTPYGRPSKADVDPFVGVETYSMKYEPKKNTLPQLDALPFNKELFPKELWSTLEGEEGDEVRAHVNRIAKKKAALILDMKSQAAAPQDSSQRTKTLLEKIKDLGEDEDATEDAEALEEEEEEDYNYEDDEDEMGGDYDAEQYFDGGENDDDDGDDGGGEY
ncbi:DNA-directed RNA polymerase III, subunit Rpc31 [Xylogone sp. PMI_703]|nr:DNA-directed RNA polymerase III, subunit Rpc31 [Xylogone sp. PMI_703]